MVFFTRVLAILRGLFLGWRRRFWAAEGASRLGWGCLPFAGLCLFCAIGQSIGQSTGLIAVAPTRTPAPTNTPAPTSTVRPTNTPAPTPTPRPTRPPAPTATPEPPTQTPEPPTPTVEATPTAPPATGDSVIIVEVNKRQETVTLRNTGNAPVDLRAWTLLSLTGGQYHPIGGILQPGETKIFPNTGREIWNNSRADPAELRDPTGRVVDRYP
jgi:hypothetical protein